MVFYLAQASASQVLGLQVCNTKPSQYGYFRQANPYQVLNVQIEQETLRKKQCDPPTSEPYTLTRDNEEYFQKTRPNNIYHSDVVVLRT
jgi:hypothetical protein